MTVNKRSNFGLSTLSFVFSLAAQRGLPFLALPIVARATSQYEYGAATLAISIGAVISVIMTLGINAAIPKFYAQMQANSKKAMWVTMVVAQVSFTLFIATLLSVLTTSSSFLAPEYRQFILPTILLASISAIQMTYQGLAIARGASGRLLSATLAQLLIGLTLAQFFSSEWGGAGYIYALLIASTVATLALGTFPHPRPEWNFGALRSRLRLAIPFVGQGLSTWLLALFDRIVIGLLLGATQVGGYQVAYMMGSVLGMILEGLQAAWGPRYYRSNSMEKRTYLSELLRPSLCLAAIMSLLLISVAPLILPLVAPNYEISFSLVALVALSAVPRSIYFVSVAGLLDDGRSTAVMIATLASAAFTVPTAWILIQLWGAVGGGLVTLIAFSLQSMMVHGAAFSRGVGPTARQVLLPLLVTGTAAAVVMFIGSASSIAGTIVSVALLILCLLISRRTLGEFSRVLSLWSSPAPPRRSPAND